MISIENVTVRVNGRCLLESVSAELQPGQMVAVVGPNGAGKTTLLRAMCGDFACTSGCVRFDGLCVRKWPATKMAMRRAVLPQHFPVNFSSTAREVVSLGRVPFRNTCTISENAGFVDSAMEATGVGHLTARPYATLSEDERQSVQLARVLAQIWGSAGTGARYLWLDEPTAGLDLAHQHGILRLARSMARQGAGVLCILHDFHLAAAYADRLIVLDKGHVAAQGPPEDVLRPELVQRVFGLQAALTL